MYLFVKAESDLGYLSSTPGSRVINEAFQAAVVGPVNGGGHWVHSLPRIIRGRENLGEWVKASLVYEVNIDPNNRDALVAFSDILRERLIANLGNGSDGDFNWSVSIEPFEPRLHAPLEVWTSGRHLENMTRDIIPGALNQVESITGETRPGENVPESADQSLRRIQNELGFSTGLLVLGLGIIAVIAISPSINAVFSGPSNIKKIKKNS